MHEKCITNRPCRYRVGVHRSALAGPTKRRATSPPQLARDPRRHLLPLEEQLPLAAFAPRLRTPWQTVYHYFRAWRLEGVWQRVHAALRQRVRVRLERDPQPSAGINDSQSVKTTGVGGGEWGYDVAKKVKGLKSAIYWWTRRDWCSKRRSTARRWWTGKASSSCWILPPPIASRASRICGWTRATREKAKVRIGCRRRWWVGRPRSCDTRRSWSGRR
jgi:hypothetical protein